MRLSSFLRTTIGKKFVVAITGLLFGGFLVTHMAANLLLLFDGDAYNKYSHALITNPLLPVAELALVVFLVTHLGLALWLSWKNRQARPVSPAKLPPVGNRKRANVMSRTMAYTGLLTLAFLVLHLWTFKYGTYYSTVVDGVEMRDLFRLVVEKFQSPLYVVWYVLSLVLLGGHLSHGIAATAQTLGFTSVRRSKWQTAATFAAWLLMAGFIVQPIFLYFGLSFAGGR
jgi:succinate dehydrogenase / fumarate reductase cytochrome b subunit